ncbi:hypothetical protein SprV_0200959200 [Sparganum proliferum]
MLLINVCASFLLDFLSNPIHSVVLHFFINLLPNVAFAPITLLKLTVVSSFLRFFSHHSCKRSASSVLQIAKFLPRNSSTEDVSRRDVASLSNGDSATGGDVVMRMPALCSCEKEGPVSAVRTTEENTPWQSGVNQMEGTKGSTIEYASPVARKVAVRPDLYTIEEVSEEEEKAAELSLDEIFEDSEMEGELNNFTPVLKQCIEHTDTVCKETLRDTTVLPTKTWPPLEESRQSVSEKAVLQPTYRETAARRRQRRNWKEVSQLAHVAFALIPLLKLTVALSFLRFFSHHSCNLSTSSVLQIAKFLPRNSSTEDVSRRDAASPSNGDSATGGDVVMRMPALCSCEKEGPVSAVRTTEENTPWQSGVNQMEGTKGSTIEYASPVARKVAVRPDLYTIEEVSEEEEKAAELSLDEIFEDSEMEGELNNFTPVLKQCIEHTDTVCKETLRDTTVLPTKTWPPLEESRQSVSEKAVLQPTYRETAARRRQRRNWKEVSQLAQAGMVLDETRRSRIGRRLRRM